MAKPSKNTGYSRPIMNTPATTMVAAWISAETGVGPAMASGSHVCSGNWPDLEHTAAISAIEAMSRAKWCSPPTSPTVRLMTSMSKVLNVPHRMITPTSRPMSPTRLVRKALRAASVLGRSSHQCPMSTKLHTPTSSQPTIIWTRFWAMTKKSIEAVNRLRKA